MKKEKIVVHDELLAKVGVALRRAAKRAREIAARTNTPIVVFENGKVVKKKVTQKCNRRGKGDCLFSLAYCG
ncbi:MAG: hypothetical protein A4E73_00310 [Syntrophaceae bacterium PtaU1.Bin231]|nr:MAG: hypothetical protein A4E73_00310 [Syntrophaceae bacterium PtaU1.Bin231]